MIKKAKISQNRPDYAETQKLLPAAFVRSTHPRREREREILFSLGYVHPAWDVSYNSHSRQDLRRACVFT